MENQEDAMLPDLPAGYIQVTLTANLKSMDLWQQVAGGEVLGYFDAQGARIDLPLVYEMSVVDGCVLEKIAPAKTINP